MPMGLDTVIAGETIESSWGNSVADRVVGRFANAAERDAAITSPVTGMLVWRTDLGAHEIRKGGAWVPLGRDTTRVGTHLTLTAQTIASGATADLVWQTEQYDTDNFHASSSTDVIIPSGLAGVYTLTVGVVAAVAVSSTCTINLIAGTGTLGHTWPAYILTGNQHGGVSATLEAEVGAALRVAMFNGHSSATQFTARLVLARISA